MTDLSYTPAFQAEKTESRIHAELWGRMMSDSKFNAAWHRRSATDDHLKTLIRRCLLKGIHELHAEAFVYVYLAKHRLRIDPAIVECEVIPAVIQEPHTAETRRKRRLWLAGRKHKPAHIDILQFLMSKGEGSPSQIAAAWDRTIDQIKAALKVMVADGIVTNIGHGRYAISPQQIRRVENIKEEVQAFRRYRSKPFHVVENVMLDDVEAGNSVHPYSEDSRKLKAWGEEQFLKTEIQYSSVDWTGITNRESWRVDQATVERIRQRWLDETASKLNLPTAAWNEPFYLKDAAAWRGTGGAIAASETPGMSLLEVLLYIKRYGMTKPVFGIKRNGRILPISSVAFKPEDFFQRCCLFQPGSITSSAELIAAHADWCKENGFRPMSGKQMAAVLVQAGCQNQVVKIDGKVTRIWRNLAVTPKV